MRFFDTSCAEERDSIIADEILLLLQKLWLRMHLYTNYQYSISLQLQKITENRNMQMYNIPLNGF